MKQDIGYYQEFGDSMMLNSRNVWSDHRLTADKRLRYASAKLPSATSFIYKTLCASLTKAEWYKLPVVCDGLVEKMIDE